MSAVASCLPKDAAPNEVIDVMVTCDGTWSKRGHTALFGVVVMASWETGQVLDVEVLSKWTILIFFQPGSFQSHHLPKDFT